MEPHTAENYMNQVTDYKSKQTYQVTFDCKEMRSRVFQIEKTVRRHDEKKGVC